MSTLDEITKEKQRVGEALARIDAQRERLVSQLRELEATERVLARYTKALATGRTQQEITAACKQGCSPEACRHRHCPAQTGWPRRRARRKALRHTGDGDGATRRGLTSG